MPHSFYVYYKVPANNAVAASTAVNELFRRMMQEAGVIGRLMRRADDASTWMEVYEDVPDASCFNAMLRSASEQCGLHALVEGGTRHVEQFVSWVYDELAAPAT
jgi:hypothetical protein